MNSLLAIALGSFFGFALYLVGATNPLNILKMLRLNDLSLAKSILFAIGLGSVLLSVFHAFNLFDVTHLSVKTLHSGVVIGGIIFGIGFGLAGSCPGTSVAGLLTNTFKQSALIVLGGLVGAFIFSITYPQLRPLTQIFDFGKLTLFNISNDYDAIFNFGYSGLLSVGILFMLGALFLPKKILN